MTTTCENSVFGGLFRAWKRSRLGDILLGGRVVVSMHTYDGGGIFQATLTAHFWSMIPCRLFIFTHPKPKQNLGHLNSWVISDVYWSVFTPPQYFEYGNYGTTLCATFDFNPEWLNVPMFLAIHQLRIDYFEWNFCSGDCAYSAAVIVAVAAVAYETSAQRDLQFVRICQTK